MNIELKNIENLTYEEINQLEMLVEKANKPKRKRFVPKKSEGYYNIKETGEVDRYVFDNDNIDNKLLKIKNCFRTKEEAQYYADRIKLITELWDFADENNEGEIDWENNTQEKHTFCYDFSCKEILISSWFQTKYQPVLPYFTSKEIFKKAINHFGEERLKTLFLNYGEK